MQVCSGFFYGRTVFLGGGNLTRSHLGLGGVYAWELPFFIYDTHGSYRYVTQSSYEVTPVIALLSHASVFRPNAAEVAEIFEVPLSLVMDP